MGRSLALSRHAALSRFASVNPSPLPPTPFFPPNQFSLRIPEVSGSSYSLHQSRSIIRTCTLRRDRSFLLPRVVAKRARCLLHRRYLEDLDPCLDRIRRARMWVWVEVCTGRRLGRLGGLSIGSRTIWVSSNTTFAPTTGTFRSRTI